MPTERELLIALAVRQGSFSHYRRVLEHYPSLGTGLDDNFVQIPDSRLRTKLQSVEWLTPKQQSFAACSLLDSQYPEVFRDLSEPPLMFWYEGDLTVLDSPTVSIVGSRRITPSTRRYLDSVIPELVAANLVTVSGLAYGVDEAVHRQTLRSGGRTVGVLGNSLDYASFSPKTAYTLAREVLTKGGLLVSEYPEGTRGARYTFPRRNRLVAALSPVTVVAQAALKSGSLITAQWATKLGRTVCTPSVDYFETSVGGNRELISRGARVLTNAAEILAEYSLVESSGQEPSSSRIAREVEFAEVCKHFGLDTQTGLAELTTLELTGRVASTERGTWIIFEAYQEAS